MNIKIWCENLTQREKLTVTIGSIASIVVLAYFFLYAPLQDSVQNLKNTVSDNQHLLSWIQDADTRLKQARKGPQLEELATADTLLGIVQNSLKKTTFLDKLPQIKQSSHNTVSVQFDKAPFDNLTHWMTSLWLAHGVNVTRIDAQAIEKSPGIVQVTVVLSEALI